MEFRIFKKSTNELLTAGYAENLYDLTNVDGLINKALYACVACNILPSDIEIEFDCYTDCDGIKETYVMCLTGELFDISLKQYEIRWYDNNGDITQRCKCNPHLYLGSL